MPKKFDINQNEFQGTLEDFCYKVIDGLYSYGFPFENQCAGYQKLIYCLVAMDKRPSEEDLTFLHVLLRPYIVNFWELLRNLESKYIRIEKHYFFTIQKNGIFQRIKTECKEVKSVFVEPNEPINRLELSKNRQRTKLYTF
jgi:hypothetical protein